LSARCACSSFLMFPYHSFNEPLKCNPANEIQNNQYQNKN
jgi:hypothetical protein